MSVHSPITSTSVDQKASPSPPRRHTSRSDRIGGAGLILGGVVLLVGLLVVPGPDVADVHRATWVPGHALNAAGFLLLVIAMPSLAPSFRGRLGVLGLVGYATLMTRLVMSTGSHLYNLWTLPRLASLPDLTGRLGDRSSDPLASIYSAHNVVIGAVIGVGLLALAISLWRIGRPMRIAAALLVLAAVGEVLGVPVSLVVFVILGCWLGLRVALRGDATAAIRR